MERIEDMEKLWSNLSDTTKLLLEPLRDNILFLENHLAELRKYPFIEVNPNNPTQQRATHAAKQYRELIQQYNSCVKVLLKAAQNEGASSESPLRAYIQKLREKESMNGTQE